MKKKKKKNGCGPIAGNHWLNYVTPSILHFFNGVEVIVKFVPLMT